MLGSSSIHRRVFAAVDSAVPIRGMLRSSSRLRDRTSIATSDDKVTTAKTQQMTCRTVILFIINHMQPGHNFGGSKINAHRGRNYHLGRNYRPIFSSRDATYLTLYSRSSLQLTMKMFGVPATSA